MKTYQVRVYFEDTDCGGIVYHTNYIKYCERARSEIFFTKNSQPFSGKCGFVVKSINANFIRTSKLGDLLEVRSKIIEIKNASFILGQDIYQIYDANINSKCDRLVFSASVMLAFVDLEKEKVTKITPQMLEILKDI